MKAQALHTVAYKAMSNTMEEGGSEVERWSWLSSIIKQFSSSQNIYAANRLPLPPTHPTNPKRIAMSNFQPPASQIPAKENPKLAYPDVSKARMFESKHISFDFIFGILYSWELIKC